MDTAITGGDRIRFELVERLGKGAAGSVWRARMWGRHGMTRMVALKVVEAGDERVLRRMRDEARLLGLLQHRALVAVQDLVELEEGRWGLVMELLDGVDLHGLAVVGSLPPGIVLEVVAEVADALVCALETVDLEGVALGLTHRDIKPANIMMCQDGRVKLLDFGVARANITTRESTTIHGELWGTLGYMSPERLFGQDSPAVDVYALGVVLYELVLRQRLGRASLAQSEHEVRLIEARRRLTGAGVPEGMIALVLSMLAYHAADRPTAAEVRDRARALRVEIPAPTLGGWAGRVVPLGRRARLSRLGPAVPTMDLWTIAISSPPSNPPVETVPHPSAANHWRWVRRLSATVGRVLGALGMMALVLAAPCSTRADVIVPVSTSPLQQPSSTSPSQLLSMPSQISVASGDWVASSSLQSWLLGTAPSGWVQAVTVASGFP